MGDPVPGSWLSDSWFIRGVKSANEKSLPLSFLYLSLILSLSFIKNNKLCPVTFTWRIFLFSPSNLVFLSKQTSVALTCPAVTNCASSDFVHMNSLRHNLSLLFGIVSCVFVLPLRQDNSRTAGLCSLFLSKCMACNKYCHNCQLQLLKPNWPLALASELAHVPRLLEFLQVKISRFLSQKSSVLNFQTLYHI